MKLTPSKNERAHAQPSGDAAQAESYSDAIIRMANDSDPDRQ
jgi:hypothetical protein